MEGSTRRKQLWFPADHACPKFSGDVLYMRQGRRAAAVIVIALAEFYARPRHSECVSSSDIESDPVIPVEILWRVPSQMSRLFSAAGLKYQYLSMKRMAPAVEGNP